MFTLIETFTSHSDMGTRVIGTYPCHRQAYEVMRRMQNRFYHSVDRNDYPNFSYKTGATKQHIAWVDVVCSDDTFGNTWTIIDSSAKFVVNSRHFG